MAQNNGFNAMWGISFEDFESVKKKLNVLTNQINSETSKGIKFGIDTNAITKTISDLSKLAKQNIQILPDGQITVLSKFNQELGKTVSLKKNLSTGEETISLNVDNDKIRKDTENMYKDLFKQQEDISKMQQQMTQNQRKEAQQEAQENNRILEDKYRSEQQFINASQNLKQKSSKESLKQAQQEAKISNDLLKSQYEEKQSQKAELEDAQKLIAYEKQRLQIRLNGVELNRKGLYNENYSSKIGEGINGLSGNNTSEVKDKVKQLNIELQKLDQNARMQGLQVGNKNIMSLGESIKSTATKLGIFASTAMVLNEVQNAVRNASSYIIELDSAMVGLKKVTSETNDTYDKFLKNMHNTALELGTQSNLMVDATTNWAKTGKSLEEASKLAENTILLTKVGDVDNVDTAQQFMIAPLKAFNIEAERSIELIDKYNNISNNMATTVVDVGEGLNIASSSLGVARNSLEESIALISTAESTTKAGGSVVGNALKTISLRLATFKDDETGELIPTLADDLKKLGVEAVDSAGQIRSTFDILKDLGEIYKGLDTNTQLKLSEQIGGKRQANIVASILTNVDELDRAYGLATDSAGSAMGEFEKYQDGIQYSLDQLKERVNGLYTSFLNGGFFKGLIDGAGDVISVITTINNTFGTMPTVITTVGIAMTLFNTKFRESMQTMMSFNPALNKVFISLNGLSSKFTSQANIYKAQIERVKALIGQYQAVGLSTTNLGKNLLSLNGKLALTTAKLVATQVATVGLEAVMSIGLSLAISAVIGAVSGFVKSFTGAEERIEAVDEKSKALSETLTNFTNAEVDLSAYEKISKKLEETNLSEEQKNDLNGQLLELKKKLYSLDEGASAILDNDNLKYEEQLELLRQINEQKLYDRAKELDEQMGNGFWNQDESKNAERANAELEKSIRLYDQIEALKGKGGSIRTEDGNGFVISADEVDGKLKELEGTINQNYLTVQKYNSGVELMNKTNLDSGRTVVELADGTKVFMDTLKESTSELDKNTKAKNDNASAGGSGNSGSDNSISVADSTKSYSQALSKGKELQNVLNEVNQEQEMTVDLVAKISEMYPEIGARITSIADVQEFLNGKIKDQETVATQAYNQMVSQDEDFYNNKFLNNEQWVNQFRQSLIDMGMSSEQANNLDLSQFQNLQQLKSYAMNELGKGVEAWLNQYIDTSAEGYNIDFRNFRDSNEAKLAVLNALNQEISKVNGNIIRQSISTASISNMSSFTNNPLAKKMTDQLAQDVAKLKDLQVAVEEVNTKLPDFQVGLGGGLSFNSPIIGGGGSGSGGSGGSGGGSSPAEREVEDMEKLYDKYSLVDNALKKLDNELKINKSLMNNASDKNKITYLEKELQLIRNQEVAYKNKRAEQEKELAELRNGLSSNGFGFGGDGEVSNPNRIDNLVNWANSLSGNNKENAQNNVKAIYENLKRYNELLLTQIPEINNNIIDLKNTTIDTQKEIVELIKKQKDSYIENIEKETEALKKAIEKRRDLRNAEWENDDYRDELKKKQDSLLDLESQLQDAMRMADGELVSNIKKQIETAQQEVNNFIRDNERDKADQRYDEELTKIDEDSQKKIDEINAKLTDEEILRMVQNGVRDLSSVLDSVGNANKNITSTFTSVGDIIQNNWLGNLDAFISKLKGINNVDLNLNANVNRSIGNAQNNKGTASINLEYKLVVEGGVDEDVLPKVEKMIKKAQDETVKRISDLV